MITTTKQMQLINAIAAAADQLKTQTQLKQMQQTTRVQKQMQLRMP
jgi:hypothetical protein